MDTRWTVSKGLHLVFNKLRRFRGHSTGFFRVQPPTLKGSDLAADLFDFDDIRGNVVRLIARVDLGDKRQCDTDAVGVENAVVCHCRF